MNRKYVKPKKHLGQHFLKDESVAQRTANLVDDCGTSKWLEIGPGTGVLTKYLLEKEITLLAVELDGSSVKYLHQNFPDLPVVEDDFLQMKLPFKANEAFGIIGNFPYNISTQIVFRILEERHRVPTFAGMFQLEVAERYASKHGSKKYGITSVLTQAYYDVELVFEIPPEVFTPPPKVMSAVILAKRKSVDPHVDHKLFFDVVKTAFQQRRKTLWNALKKFGISKEVADASPYFTQRAEQLSVDEFLDLTRLVEESRS